MATTKKRQEAIQQMRQRILEAAETMFIREGYEETTMRKIAKAIACNPATLYNYYENKEAIFFALQEKAFSSFYEEFEDFRKDERKGYEKLRSMGRRYFDFAMKNPNKYELMFIMKSPMRAAESLDPGWETGSKNYELLKEVVATCIEEDSIHISDVDSGAFMIWSMMHGMVALMIMDRCPMMLKEDMGFVAKEAHLSFEKMLKKK